MVKIQSADNPTNSITVEISPDIIDQSHQRSIPFSRKPASPQEVNISPDFNFVDRGGLLNSEEFNGKIDNERVSPRNLPLNLVQGQIDDTSQVTH